MSGPDGLPERVTVNTRLDVAPVSVIDDEGDDNASSTTTAAVASKSTLTFSVETITFEDMETEVPLRVNAAVTT